jgi:hypothetical protein
MEVFGQLVIAVLGVTTIIFQGFRTFGRGPGRERRSIRYDAETVGMLPESAKARERLLTHLDNTIREMIERETEFRRNPRGMLNGFWSLALGSLLILSAVGTVARASDPGNMDTNGGFASILWTILGVPMIAVGVWTLVKSMRKVKRDRNGNPVHKGSSQVRY